MFCKKMQSFLGEQFFNVKKSKCLEKKRKVCLGNAILFPNNVNALLEKAKFISCFVQLQSF